MKGLLMKHEEDHYNGFGGLQLYYQHWLPDSKPARAVIVMLHGDFAHSGWYMNLPQHEVPRGYTVYAYDRRGWGHSPGQRGYIDRWSDQLGDLDAFLQVVRAKEPDLPIFLMGHTGSSPIVLDYADQHPRGLNGVFCVSPVLNTGEAVPALLRQLLHFLSRVLPHLTINVRRRFEAQVSNISRDPAFAKFIREDPFCNTMITPRWLTESERGMQHVMERAADLQVPLLILVGGADRNSSPETAKSYFQNVIITDKELHEYPGAYTNLLSETNYEEVLNDIDTWLDKHL
jgi:alpha-beta hydrolase superfamily lysophospholipase